MNPAPVRVTPNGSGDKTGPQTNLGPVRGTAVARIRKHIQKGIKLHLGLRQVLGLENGFKKESGDS